jgi:hypothetical protein
VSRNDEVDDEHEVPQDHDIQPGDDEDITEEDITLGIEPGDDEDITEDLEGPNSDSAKSKHSKSVSRLLRG